MKGHTVQACSYIHNLSASQTLKKSQKLTTFQWMFKWQVCCKVAEAIMNKVLEESQICFNLEKEHHIPPPVVKGIHVSLWSEEDTDQTS